MNRSRENHRVDQDFGDNEFDRGLDCDSFELQNSRLRVREGLRFSLHDENGEPVYVVHDPVAQTFHQIGISQYAFLSAIDGQRTIEDVVRKTATDIPDRALSMAQAEKTTRWLLDANLVYAIDHSGRRVESARRLETQADPSANSELDCVSDSISRVADSMFWKFRLGDPGDWLQRNASRWFWLFSTPALVIVGLLGLLAVFLLWNDADAVVGSLGGVVDGSSAGWLLVCFVGLKLVHEFGHAIACHRVGGRVRETGLMFILFVPIPYVDVTSVWSLSDRRSRMLVSSAGMIVELAIASLAAIGWACSSDEVLRYHLLNLVLMGTLTTLLFNANFLMRFDGYFLLSDATGIANLAPKSRQCVTAYARKIFLGRPLSLPADISQRRVLLLLYGIASIAWRWAVCVGLAMVASKMLLGFGLILTLACLAVWFGRPILRFVCELASDQPESVANRGYLIRRVAPIVAVIVILASWVPWPWNVSAPAVVRHRDHEFVRAAVAGFIGEVHVRNGQTVKSGDPLLTLSNADLDTQITKIESQLAASRLRARREWVAGNVAASQAESSLGDSLQVRLEELVADQAEWQIRATSDGQVVWPEYASGIGRYVHRGAEVLQIVAPEKKELFVAVAQEDRDAFASNLNQRVVFRSHHRHEPVVATLARLQSQGQVQTDARLTASAGGALPERLVGEERFLLRPCFEADVPLDRVTSLKLHAGTTGRVELHSQPHSVASYVLRKLWSWLSPIEPVDG